MNVLDSHSPYRLRSSLWSLRRLLGLSPTQEVFREIRRRGVPTGEMAAVEVFAGTGFRHTMDYCPFVRSLELWEVNPAHAAALRRNVPGAKVRITDTFKEVLRTPERFGIIVVDNTITTFGDGHIEHLDLFPGLFRIAADRCVMVLNVCPEVPAELRADAERMFRRAAFYGTNTPHDIPIDLMAGAYGRLASAKGFRLDWHFERRRAHRARIHYLVLALSKTGGHGTSPV